MDRSDFLQRLIASVTINKPGRYVHVKDDGIYTYMYEIDDDIVELTDEKGKRWLEFFLI